MTALGVVKLGVGSLVLAVMVAPALTVRAQSQPDRSKPPSLGPTPQLKLPAIQKRTLSNGVPVWLVEQREVPLVQVTLLLKSGASDDPSGKFGLASLTAAMLDEGAGARSALEIADEIEFLGADLTTSSSFDASAVGWVSRWRVSALRWPSWPTSRCDRPFRTPSSSACVRSD